MMDANDLDFTNAMLHLNLLEVSSEAQLAKPDQYYQLMREISASIKTVTPQYTSDSAARAQKVLRDLASAFELLKELAFTQLSLGQEKKAIYLLQQAQTVYDLFASLNAEMMQLNVVTVTDNVAKTTKVKKRRGLVGKLGVLVQKVIDCCIE